MSKNNKWLIALLVLLLLWEIFTIASIKSQNKNLESQINDLNNNLYGKTNSIHDSVYDIKSEISEELEKQASILSSHSTSISFVNGILNLDLSITPKEYRNDEEVELVVVSDKETKTFPAINQDGIFRVKGGVLPSEKINATVRFVSPETTRQETLEEIDVAQELAFEYDAYLLGDRLFHEEGPGPTEEEHIEASNTIVVGLMPFNYKGRVNPPYADLESAKLVLTNRANSKKALEVDLEKTTQAKYTENFMQDEGTSILLGDISAIKDTEGSFRVECELQTKEGLFYNFEIGEVNNYKNSNNNKIFPNISIYSMGIAYPEF